MGKPMGLNGHMWKIASVKFGISIASQVSLDFKNFIQTSLLGSGFKNRCVNFLGSSSLSAYHGTHVGYRLYLEDPEEKPQVMAIKWLCPQKSNSCLSLFIYVHVYINNLRVVNNNSSIILTD